MLPQLLKQPAFEAFRRKANQFCKDRYGVAAVEFAFLAPILLIMYFLTIEASQAIETNKKVSRLGSMVADLVAQKPEGTINKAEIQSIMDIGQTTLLPYARSKPTIMVTGIQLSDEPTPRATVAWSRKLDNGSFGGGLQAGSAIVVPPALAIRNTFLVKVESSLTYTPLITWVAGGEQSGLLNAFNALKMGESYLLRPRTVAQLTCSDC